MTRRLVERLSERREPHAEREAPAALDRGAGRTNWTALGSRVLQAASVAAALHMAERARKAAETAEQPWAVQREM